MILWIDGHDFHYEMENLCRIFFPYQKIIVVDTNPQEEHILENDGLFAATHLHKDSDGFHVKVNLRMNQAENTAEELVSVQDAAVAKELERRMAVLLYGLLTKACAFQPKWGILTGVRPVKLLRNLSTQMGLPAAERHFEQAFMVAPEKIKLCHITMEHEKKLLALSKPNAFSLYISIPFCPTRCSYCSFVSSAVAQTMKLIPEYVRLLCVEIQKTAQVSKELNLQLESVYIGGGTPTTLSAEQLALIMDTINQYFDLSNCREFTVEAGRPDTITPEKLEAMRPRGITRISINPQTLNDAVLNRIGRRHTSQQTIDAYKLARECGYTNINMDLIAGLPGDSFESFCKTLDEIITLQPENITVHTLALKRAARLFQDESKSYAEEALPTAKMLDYAGEKLLAGGWIPYYLYRQSRMVGNLENTGWAKPGFESFYNVYIMEEMHTILACGAGAVSKLYDAESGHLERIFNFKYPHEYIHRHSEILDRKEQVKTIYDAFGN